jgi:hypothetical protein
MNMRAILLVGLVLTVSLSRLVDHPPNFTPVLAVALFSAACFSNRWVGMFVPMGVMLLSDVALEVATRNGLLSGWLAHGKGFYSGMWVVYLAVGLTWALGLVLRRNRNVWTIGTCSLAGSLLFYLITNFAWWAGYDQYPHTWQGLLESYVLAIPFFGWTLVGTMYYAALLFGGYALAHRLYPTLQTAGA